VRAVKARLKELEAKAYQVLPAIMERIQQHKANNTPQHSYNYIIMDEATQTAMEEQRKQTQPGVRHIYSDGSVVDLGKARCAMAFAVVGEQQPVIQGTTKGFASSVKAELMGLIAGIIATPQDQDVCIRLDNQKVVKQFKEIVVNRRRATMRAKLRCDHAVEWAIVARICSERTGSTTVEWVKGHRGDRWNEAADKAAKEAQLVVGKAWEVNAKDQDDLRYTATMAGTTLEIDTRQALKMQTTRRWHQTWRSLKRHKRSIQDYGGTDWLGTIAIIHSNKPVHTFYSSQQDTRLRSHRIKKIHGMLPTMDALHARRPDLYKDDQCRRCQATTEDNEHIWLCPKSRDAHDEIWKDGLGRIDFWGAIATKRYNKERKRRKEGEAQLKEIEWVAASVRTCRRALRRIIQWPSTEDGHEEYTGDEKWTVCHILRGLVPKALATEWARVFKEMPKSVVEHVSRLFCRFIEKEGREKIWKPRCERTVEWEKQHGITERRKHKPPEDRPRSQWQQIYGRKPRENECRCGRLLEEHEDDRCPGVQNDTQAADRAVIETLLGRRRMDIMERRGAMTVKNFEVEDT
jgi:ribonuclease HI